MILSASTYGRPLTLLLAATLGTSAAGCSPQPRAEPPADATVSASDSIRTSASGSVTTSPEPAASPVPTSLARDTAVAEAGKPVPAPRAAAKPAEPVKPASAPAPASTSTPTPTPALAPTPAPLPPTSDDGYLQYDAATNTVTFKLVAGPFAFNGYTGGDATLTVPPRSANIMNFEQADGTPHSAEISSGSGAIPNSGGDPAIPRAYTDKVVEGLVQGSKDVMRFTAPDSGAYRIICGTPGHALSGMWIWYKVDPAVKVPSFGPTPK